jgi:ATP synthase protein I
MKQSPAPVPGDGNDVGPGGDPWSAFGYLVAGVAVYGAAGWGLSVWLDAGYWIPIGILVGAGFGLYMVFARYLLRPGADSDQAGTSSKQELTGLDQRKLAEPDAQYPSETTPDAARKTRPASDDRGETA